MWKEKKPQEDIKMRFDFETKPTAHKSECWLCEKPILKGKPCLKAEQFTYPGYRIGRLCLRCLKKGVKQLEKKNGKTI